MRKFLFVLLTMVALVSFAYGQTGSASLNSVKAQLSGIFPNFEVDSVSESPISGLYEVVSKDGQILYWSPEGYMIFGEIWTKTGKSVTAERRQEIMKKKFESLDLSQAIKTGNGKNKIIAFIDPECPYCKRGYEFLSKRSDYTEYLFFLPFHGDSSKRKAAYVICSKDKEKAYREVMSGRQVTVSQECIKQADSVIQKHMSIARTVGVAGTPTYVINGTPVYGANIPLIENLLNGGK
ncbi:MAG: DsbC family protein [Candidatus Bathyarchaeia archaeon]